jgi:acyl-CoA hydrolase
MSDTSPEYFKDLKSCVDAIIDKVGKKIVVAGGFGMPRHIFNGLYEQACIDPEISLTIITGMSINKPRGSNDLEKRFLDPFADRVFGNLPDLTYLAPYKKQQLPANIEVIEIFFQAGAFLGNATAQQNYVYSNFTHWLRDMMSLGCNVFGQEICSKMIDGKRTYSMSADAYAQEIFPRIKKLREAGGTAIVVGQVNEEAPFMYNDAIVPEQTYDIILDNPIYHHTILCPPSPMVDTTDYMIGLNASALIPDGGTLQVGIGALGDALTYGCILREKENAQYRDVLSRLGVLSNYGDEIKSFGGVEPFSEGIYGSTEMFADGYRHLIDNDILKREVYDSVVLQRLINERKITKQVSAKTLTTLIDEGGIHPQLTAEDVSFLCRFGIFREGVSWLDGALRAPDGSKIDVDLNDEKNKSLVCDRCLGTELQGGIVLHAGFFLGPGAMYEALRNMSEAESKKICMTDIGYVNHLYGCQEIASLQRQGARFINTTIMVTLLGAACSDGLEDGRKISGVGGQYNFVAMAPELEGGHAILMCRSTRTKGDKVTSNIVWKYGHTTIPAHLRDIVVTEYGIADLRSKREKEIVARLLNITDSRFQESLLLQAKEAGKIPRDYEIPEQYRNNTPERLEAEANLLREQGLFPKFPFGTDFTPEELVLGDILSKLKVKFDSKTAMFKTLAGTIDASAEATEAAQPYLQRMGMENPETIKDLAMQKIMVAELKHAGHI